LQTQGPGRPERRRKLTPARPAAKPASYLKRCSRGYDSSVIARPTLGGRLSATEASDLADDVLCPAPALSRAERRSALGHGGATVWLTGLSGAGKSTLAGAVEERLVATGRPAYRLDGDDLRTGLCRDLGFDPASRAENVRRAAEAAKLLAKAGTVAVVSLISPYREGRAEARALHQAEGLPFFEVWVDTPLAECERRDPKGLYARARCGEIDRMTGVQAPYEAPRAPDLVVTPEVGLAAAADRILALIATTASEAAGPAT
jgi:bifunctional enzyme CysN/CysC